MVLFLEPLGVQRPYAPHLIGPISGKVVLKGQGRASTVTSCQAQLEKAISHLKQNDALDGMYSPS